ncbi:MAG: phosphoribosyltransferase family protein [Flavobacteriaceae bacterium]|nr:phosphoribosyltransferase family protein [Flavobacteriaceae bacterium]
MFTDREQAGELLAKELSFYKNNKDVVVVAVPRGGVPIGLKIAIELNAPLELVLSKKIGHPFNKEYAIGAVTLKSRVLSDAANEVSKEYIEEETLIIRAMLNKRISEFYENRVPMILTNKIVILVDDGIATGNTLLSSIELIQNENPAQIIVAIPVASDSALQKINNAKGVKNVICLLKPNFFQAVGQFYNDFYQVSDTEVKQLLQLANENYIRR